VHLPGWKTLLLSFRLRGKKKDFEKKWPRTSQETIDNMKRWMEENSSLLCQLLSFNIKCLHLKGVFVFIFSLFFISFHKI
jgi:hypothetical protein